MNFHTIVVIVILTFTSLAVSSCTSNEERIRQIVKEELSAALERHTFTDEKTIGPYSTAQQVGNFLFVSGQIAINRQTGVLNNENIETETRVVLDNIMNILRQANYDSTDVITTTVYLREIGDYQRMNLIYGGYFQEGRYPVRTTVQVAALPREARVEISAIAFKSH